MSYWSTYDDECVDDDRPPSVDPFKTTKESEAAREERIAQMIDDIVH